MTLESGSFLVSNPKMVDPNFEGTVVLVCRHEDDGALGLTLNRALDAQLRSLVPEVDFLDEDPPLQWGGPVGLDRLHVLHDSPLSEEYGMRVLPELWFGGDLDAVRRMHEAGGRFRFFLGYSGWGEGQLDDELAQGAWLVVPPDAREVWERGSEKQWERLVATQVEGFRWMAHTPDDPDSN